MLIAGRDCLGLDNICSLCRRRIDTFPGIKCMDPREAPVGRAVEHCQIWVRVPIDDSRSPLEGCEKNYVDNSELEHVFWMTDEFEVIPLGHILDFRGIAENK